MRPAVELKDDFEVISSHGDIIDVLKTATLIQFRSFQGLAKPLTAFTRYAEDALECVRLKFRQDEVFHPVFDDRKDLPSVIVVISTDDGFIGEINSVLVNIALEQRRSKADQLVVLGERGARHLEDMKEKFAFFPGLSHQITRAEVERVRKYVFDLYRKTAGRVIVVHPMFVSLVVQKVMVWRPFPYSPEGQEEGSSANRWHPDDPIEPSPVRAAEGLAEVWFGGKLLEVFWTAKLAEYAARIMHLEESSQELKHRQKNLMLEYFRQVHTVRDKTIREITASRYTTGRRSRI